MSTLRVASIVLAVSVSLSLAGCAADSDLSPVKPSPTSSTGSGASTSTAVPGAGVAEATPSATPAPPAPDRPEAGAATCENLLEPGTLAEKSTGNFGLPDQAGIDAYVNKTRDEGSDFALFVDNGGLLCPITNGFRVAEVYGFSPVTADQATAAQAGLIAEGFTATSSSAGDLFTDAADREGIAFAYRFTDGYWFCAYDLATLDEVVANAPR
jgi:hypothetical protein